MDRRTIFAGGKEREVYWITWNDVEGYCSNIVSQVRRDYKEADSIIGIGLGGNIATELIAKELGIKHAGMFVLNSYKSGKRGEINVVSRPEIDLEGRKVLVIDDISDSGSTIKFIRNELIQQYLVDKSDIKIATLVYKKGSEVKPDFFAQELDMWCVFPWEPKEKGYWKAETAEI